MWLSRDEYSEIPSQGRHKECLPLLSRSLWLTKARFHLGNQLVYFAYIGEGSSMVWVFLSQKLAPESLYSAEMRASSKLYRWYPQPSVGYSSSSLRPCAIKAEFHTTGVGEQLETQMRVLWPRPHDSLSWGGSFVSGELVGSGLYTEASEVEDGTQGLCIPNKEVGFVASLLAPIVKIIWS